MKYIVKWGSALVVMLFLSSCTSVVTKDGLYSEETSIEEEITVLDEELVDIFDEEVALGGLDLIVEGFDLSNFTDRADAFTDRLYEDVALAFEDDEDYNLYLSIAEVPKDDLMAVVNVEFEHLMQFDDGVWVDRRSEYPNSQGYTVSSFQNMDGLYMYDITYNDLSGSYKVVRVRYDSILDCYDYSSESFSEDEVLSYVVRQQFCRDDEGGYYYQAIRQGILDGYERVAFSHFNEDSYEVYVRPADKIKFADGFAFDLFDGVPDNIDLLTLDFKKLQSFTNDGVSFKYDVD